MLEEFKKYLILHDMNNNYAERIKRFIAFCQRRNISYDGISYADLQDFFLELKQSLSNGSINNHINALRKFYQFLVELQHVRPECWELTKKIKLLATTQTVKDYITKDELGDIVEMGESFVEHIEPLKLRAILYFLFYTGLRRNEFLNLKRENINLSEHTVVVKGPTKNRLERVVFFPRRIAATKERKAVEFVQMLQDYFALEPETINAFNITRPGLEYLVRLLKDFAPKKKLTIHTFRHSFARMLAREGVDSRIAQKLLGHKDIATTMIYYDPDIDTVEKIYKEKVK